MRHLTAAITAALSISAAAAGCSSSPEVHVNEPLAFDPTHVSAGVSADLVAIRADLDELETVLRDPFVSTPDLSIHAFRLGRLLDDLDTLVRENTSAEAWTAFGRALALSAHLQHPGADAIAAAMFERAEALAPADHGPPLRLGQLHLEQRRYAKAIDALERAAQRHDTALPPRLHLDLADAYIADGRFDDAAPHVDAALAALGDDLRTQELKKRLDRGERERGHIRIGLDGQALVDYALTESGHWQIQHHSLSFQIDLPLDWQVVDQRVDLETGGVLELLPPPSLGTERGWNSDLANLWVVQLAPGEDLRHIRDTYLDALDGAQVLADLDPLGHVGAIRAQLRLVEGGQERYGEVFMMVRADSAYIFEYWGDPVSYLERSHEISAVVASFSSTIGDPVAAQ